MECWDTKERKKPNEVNMFFPPSFFLSLKASDCLCQETLHAEHLSRLGAIPDAQKTVNRILEVAQVLYYLDQVSFWGNIKTFSDLYSSGWMFLGCLSGPFWWKWYLRNARREFSINVHSELIIIWRSMVTETSLNTFMAVSQEFMCWLWQMSPKWKHTRFESQQVSLGDKKLYLVVIVLSMVLCFVRFLFLQRTCHRRKSTDVDNSK